MNFEITYMLTGIILLLAAILVAILALPGPKPFDKAQGKREKR